ncbi:MAG: phosphotyrosine protein phosphatase [Bacteroidota bacterium]
MHVLFVCSRNRRRSPTAERLFDDPPAIRALSAGTAPDAETRVSLDLLQWADLVACMERRHAGALQREFGPHLANVRVTTLGIPDDYEPDDPALVQLLRQRLAGVLP